VAVGFIKALNKGVLLGLAGLDKLQLNAFSSDQPIKVAERSSLPLSRRIVFGKPWISSNYSRVRTTLVAGRLISISMAKISRLDSSITLRVLKGLP
jgi:hypothetical protein